MKSSKLFVLLLAIFASAQYSFSQNEKPNMVFIFIDDMGYKDAGCYGSPLAETPNIDHLASEGMLFTDAYASPVCSPTRASLISGQNSARNGVWEVIGVTDRPYGKMKSPAMASEIPAGIETFANILDKEGYTVAHVGKWHAGRTPSEHGFISLDSLDIKDPALKKYAQKNKEKHVGEYTAKSIEFLRENKDHPFMLNLHHHAVHVPIQARRDLNTKYLNKIRHNGIRNINPNYAAMVEMVDESVGAVLSEIDNLGLRDNTVVIFYSDNGGLNHDVIGNTPLATSNLPLRGQKGGLYEGGIRVPLIVRWPGVVEPGTECHAPVMSYDLYSTFVDIGGGKIPAGQTCDGESIVPLLRQEANSLQRQAIYWYFPTSMYARHPFNAIRMGDYKLIENLEGGSVELYNLRFDMGEEINLAGSRPDVARQLLDNLHNFLKEVNAPMPVANPDYDPAREEEMGRQWWWKDYE